MSSLESIVRAMSDKSSTLEWDVVLNYSVQQLNAALEALHQTGAGQLTILKAQLSGYDEDDNPFTTYYSFELGAPVIQFDAYSLVPSCTLTIPIVGGTVQTTKKTWTIYPEIYSLTISRIVLATINDTDRNSQSNGDPFLFPATPGTTGVVTLDLITSGNSLEVIMEISAAYPDKHIHKIDAEKWNLVQEIKDFFGNPDQVSFIRWDLARVSNIHPSSGGPELVPKSFCFAVYVPDGRSTDSDGVLSVYIQANETHPGEHGTNLQHPWSTQWSDYGVSPIPSSHSASIIFSNRMILKMFNLSLSDQNMKAEDESGDGSKWKILTGKRFILPPMSKKDIEWDGGSAIGYNGAQVDLNQDGNTLLVTLSQDGKPDTMPRARLEWNFQYSTEWYEDIVDMGGESDSGGKLTIYNHMATTEFMLNDVMLNYYVLRFDLTVNAKDWDTPRIVADKPDFWGRIAGQTGWTPDWFGKDLPSLPTLSLHLLDLDFFLTTNLLLPNSKVVSFDNSPGARFPRDLYLVGDIANVNRDEGNPSTPVTHKLIPLPIA